MWTWALLRIAVVNTWSVRMSAKYTLQQAVQGGAAVSHGVDLEESGFGVGPPGRRYRAQFPGVSVSSVSIASSQSVIAAARYCLQLSSETAQTFCSTGCASEERSWPRVFR